MNNTSPPDMSPSLEPGVGLSVGVTTSTFGEVDSSPLQLLRSEGYSVSLNPFGRRLSETEIIDFLRDKDGLLAGLEPLNRRVLEAAPRLRAISRVGIGLANVDLTAAQELGIQVTNTPAGPTAAVAELTVTALLALVRKLFSANESLHRGQWRKEIGRSLDGMKVHLIGYGRIGREVARLLDAFGAHILVTDPHVSREDLEPGHQLIPLEDGLRTADAILLHASGEETILTWDRLKKVREGTLLLNAARGALVDEQALEQALEQGLIGGAWLDVFREEPYTGALTKYDQVLLTPHMGTYTIQCRRSMEMDAVQNLIRSLGVDQ